jgi:hypothetical protein
MEDVNKSWNELQAFWMLAEKRGRGLVHAGRGNPVRSSRGMNGRVDRTMTRAQQHPLHRTRGQKPSESVPAFAFLRNVHVVIVQGSV